MDNERVLFNAPEGVKILPGILIQINHYWGRGKTIGAAWKSVQKEVGGTIASIKKKPYLVYSVFHYIAPDEKDTVRTYVNEMGGLTYHMNYPPHLIDKKK